jgi:hypothetical protein
VLALADKPRDARLWKLALNTARAFQCDVEPVAQAGALDPNVLVAKYKAVCLIDVAEPDRAVWAMLEAYVQKGGSLAIVPGGPELKPDAYNKEPAAQRLLPAQLGHVVTAAKEAGVPWSDSGPPHLLLAPFRQWKREANVDFLRPEYLPRAFRYWEAAPAEEDAKGVIVTYADDRQRPALVERTVGQGRVLLFTTGFDGRRDQNDDPWWNNYLASSFYPVLVNEAVRYLAGDAEEPGLNYLCGQPVLVVLPAGPRSHLYTLQGPPGVAGANVPRADEQKQLQITQATAPGNYTVLDANGRPVTGFSVNVRPEECQLTRDPELVKKIEAVLGPESVLAVGHTASLHEALQQHWRQPLELLPGLMIALLLVLALENLLANKFYRKPAEVTR